MISVMETQAPVLEEFEKPAQVTTGSAPGATSSRS